MGNHPIFESDFDCPTDRVMTDSVDDFFNKKKKKKEKKGKKVVTATDLLLKTEDTAEECTLNPDLKVNREHQVQEDEWIEPVNEQEFVIEGGGIKRLELEEKPNLDEKQQTSSDGEEGADGDNREKTETSWNTAGQMPQPEAPEGQQPGQMPGAMPQRQEPEEEENKTASDPPKSKYVPPSQRKAAQVPQVVNKPYGRREKINIESNADFPTLGAAADTPVDGFEQVTAKSGGKSWGSGGIAVGGGSTGVSNRFQGLENH